MTRRTLRNDPDRRMDLVANGDRYDFPEADLPKLDRKHVPYWVQQLREVEAGARRLRYRLEELDRGIEQRKCWTCHGAVTGRRDRVYCSDACRQRMHRKRND
jgi:hypothetical protein